MTEHTIEELKAAVAAARAVVQRAKEAESAAIKAYDDARLEATGFKGCIAEYDDARGWGSKRQTVTYQFRVERMGPWGNHIEGSTIKKDGSLGAIVRRCDIERARNLGPYDPTSRTA